MLRSKSTPRLMAWSRPSVMTSSCAKSARRASATTARMATDSTMTSVLMLEKLATRLESSVSYSLGSITRVSVDWTDEKNDESTVPMSST